MSVAEIVKEVPNLSLDEMKEVARALREAMEDAETRATFLGKFMLSAVWAIPF